GCASSVRLGEGVPEAGSAGRAEAGAMPEGRALEGPPTRMAGGRGRVARSERVGADDLAAVAGRGGLPDARGRKSRRACALAGVEGCTAAGVLDDTERVPRLDRILDEPHRTVAEKHVYPARVSAAERVLDVPLLLHQVGDRGAGGHTLEEVGREGCRCR